MRSWTIALALLALTSSGRAAAQKRQHKDYFLEPSKKGLWLHGDALTIGAQATIESRTPIEDETFGMFSLRASGLVSTGFSEAALHADVRYLFLSVGMSMGYRNVWRSYVGPPGSEVTRDVRNDADSASSFGVDTWGYGETRARLAIPLGSVMLVTNHTMRYEDSPANAFDWFHTNIHDGGFLYRGDAVLLLRSKSLGAIGPLGRYMDMPRNGERTGELAAGLLYATRVGILRANDVFNLTLLARPGDDEFGFHILRMPLWVMVVYRASFRLLE